MFCGGICRWEDTCWHLALNLSPKPGRLKEEESSPGLLSGVKRDCFYTWMDPSLCCRVGMGRTRACDGMACPALHGREKKYLGGWTR